MNSTELDIRLDESLFLLHRFSPYEDDVPPNSIRKQSLAKLGRILRQDRQVISFHRAVVTKSHRNSLLFGLRKEHD